LTRIGLILAGFNEGNWPPRPDIDPWMNSAMRAAVGLPPKNWRSGLSAHDVYMAICSKDIIVTRADKEAGTPTTKSRWLQRMEVVVNALGLDGDIDDGAIEKAWLAKLNQRQFPNRRFGRHLVRHWQAAPASFQQPKLISGLPIPMPSMPRKFCG
jgi:ATP-dependent helicase/nuclease subunit B